MIEVVYVIEAVVIVVQLAAAYFSYEVYRYDRLHVQWLAVTVALGLMACQSAAVLLADLGFLPGMLDVVLVTGKATLPLVISLFLLAGMWSMARNFERFDVVERRTVEKARKLNEHGR